MWQGIMVSCWSSVCPSVCPSTCHTSVCIFTKLGMCIDIVEIWFGITNGQISSIFDWLIELGFNDTSTLVGHFVSSPREREKRDRRDSRRDEREGQGRKRNKNESEETEEITRGPRATIRSPEWHSHCRHADVMQHLSNPIIATNENIIIWAVLSFEEEYMGLTVNGAWSWINYQSHFNRRINVKFGGNWLSGFWRIVILYM